MIIKIKKGTHKSFRLPYFTIKRKINLNFRLIGDFTYITDDVKNQEDTNKIFGISDSYFHKIDSIRIGFRYINNNLELLAYYYNNGIHYTQKIENIESDKDYNIEISILKNNYKIKFNSIIYLFNRTSKWCFIRYLLFPYFGGQEKAKKDLIFKINYNFID